MPVNEYGQMIGESMEGYTSRCTAFYLISQKGVMLEQRLFTVEKHAEDLLAVYGPDTPREMWTYLFQGPVADMEELVSLFKSDVGS